jgi:hypothetical protein
MLLGSLQPDLQGLKPLSNYMSYSVVDNYDEETEEEAQPLPKKVPAKKPVASAKAKRKLDAEEENGADEDDDEADDDDEDEKLKKKRKRTIGATDGGSALSPEMQEFLGVERMARAQVWPISISRLCSSSLSPCAPPHCVMSCLSFIAFYVGAWCMWDIPWKLYNSTVLTADLSER